MQLNYYKWLTIKITHEYYNGEDDSSVRIRPTAETAQVFQNNTIKLIKKDDAFEFYIGLASDASDSIPPPDHLGTLTFDVFLDNPSFLNYTDIPQIDKEEQYVFQNLANRTEIAISGTLQRQDAPQVISNGLLRLDMVDIETNSLTLHFTAKQVLVKYVIVTPRDREIVDCSITNKQSEGFKGPTNEFLMANQPALGFISKETITLQETIPYNNILFLKYKDSNSSLKELKIKLPNPSSENIKLQVDGTFLVETIVYI